MAAAAAASDANALIITASVDKTFGFAMSRFLRLGCAREGLVGVELMHVIVLASTVCDAKRPKRLDLTTGEPHEAISVQERRRSEG
jgi:hypothetical protein